MGQCVTRSHAGPYAFVRQYDAESCSSNSGVRRTWGGSESKGAKRKNGGKTTKGVATSFGFRRRPASSSRADDNDRRQGLDSNGNGDSSEDLYTGGDAVSGRSTPLARPRKETAGVPLRTNRFGFRQPTGNKTAKVGDVSVTAEQAFHDVHKDKTINNNAPEKKSTNNTQNLPLLSTQISSTGVTTIIGASGLPKNVTKQTVILTYQTQQQPTERITNNALRGNSYPSDANYPTERRAYYPSDTRKVGNGYPRSASASRAGHETNRVGKYTFQSNQLPKPQYPAVKVLDNKNAKQVANITRKISGSSDGSREGSATDSGVSTSGEGLGDSPRMRRRPRNLEMVMKDAHSFHLRELQMHELDLMDDALVTEMAVIPLPKLPSTFDEQLSPDYFPIKSPSQQTPITPKPSLIIPKPSELDSTKSPMSTLERYRNRTRPSRNQPSSAEYKDEEKFVFDKAQPEILDKQNSFIKSLGGDSPSAISSSKESSPSCRSEGSHFENSTADTWNNHAAGEAMATRSQDDISLAFSISSCEDEKSKREVKETEKHAIVEVPQKTIVIQEQPPVPHPLLMKSLTLSQNDSIRSIMIGSMSSSNYSATSTSTNTSEPNNLTLTLEDSKFDIAALEASTHSLIDDETSPADSLISSTSNSDSNNDLANLDLVSVSSSAYQTANTKTKTSEPEEDAVDAEVQSPKKEDAEPDNKVMSPQTPGTPTNASGSLSLSDGRDYFDDEIADQPALVFRKSNEDSPSNKTSVDSEGKNLKKSRERIPSSPLVLRNRKLGGARGERTPSLDTLSSLASDDLMMTDNELGRSVTSLQSVDDYIERLDSSLKGLNSLDERSLHRELSSKKCAVQQWNSLLEQNSKLDRQLAALAHTSKQSLSTSVSSIASIGASLPVRTARLLQRSRAQTPDTGTGSEGAPSPAPAPASLLQDVVDIKTLLLQLKRVLQEPGEEHHSTSSETLDPLLEACGAESPARGNGRRLPPHAASTAALTPDHCADLRRQILYLQSQVEERDRLVRVLQQQMSKLTEGHTDKSSSSDDTCNVATQTDRLRPPMATNLSNGENGGLVSWNEQQNGRKVIYSDAQKAKRIVNGGKCTCGARNNAIINGDYDVKKTELTLKNNSRVGSRYLQALASKDQTKQYIKRDSSVNERSVKKTLVYANRSRSIENFHNQNLTINDDIRLDDAIEDIKTQHHTSYSDLCNGNLNGKVIENGKINGNVNCKSNGSLNGKSNSPVLQNGQSTDTDYSSDGGYKSLPSSINSNGQPKKISGIPRRSIENKFYPTKQNVKASAV